MIFTKPKLRTAQVTIATPGPTTITFPKPVLIRSILIGGPTGATLMQLGFDCPAAGTVANFDADVSERTLSVRCVANVPFMLSDLWIEAREINGINSAFSVPITIFYY